MLENTICDRTSDFGGRLQHCFYPCDTMKPARSSSQADYAPPETIGVLPPIEFGRLKIEEEIKAAAAQKLGEFGITVLDFRIKRVDYNPDVLDRIYQRMISERLQIAQRFRSEGDGESAPIAGQRERDLNEIQSSAYLRVQQIQGEADAKPFPDQLVR